jgi:hypothetical protein
VTGTQRRLLVHRATVPLRKGQDHRPAWASRLELTLRTRQ